MRDEGDRTDLLIRLRDEIAACGRPGQVDRPIVPTGWPALDRILPGGGVRRGSLVELLDERAGCGAETVAAMLTRTVCQTPGVVVIVDRDGQFYPPALAAWGVTFDRLIVVRAAEDADAMWAADQALRSRAAVAVWLRADRLTPADYRRLQLSATEGGAVGMLFRPARCRGQPTGADLQLAVEPRPSGRGRTLHVEVTRCRGGSPGGAAEVCIREQRTEVREQRTEDRKAVSADFCPLSSVLCLLSSVLY
jgi:protein ImuA